MKSIILGALHNRVAANLLAVMLILSGFIALQILNVRIFPKIEINSVNVSVPYPGATPNEIETSILKPIEERLEGLEGVRKITGLASQNLGSVVVDLEGSADIQELLDDIQTEIDRITVFPEEAEEHQVVASDAPELVMQLVLYGSAPDNQLKLLADRVRNEIAALPNVSRVVVNGTPEYLIDVSIDEATLQSFGLSLTGIAQTISQQSLDLSGGEIETPEIRRLVRALGERRSGEEFADIVITSGATGTPVYLGDIATIRDGLAETPLQANYNGETAVVIAIYAVGDEKVLDLAADVQGYVDNTLPTSLPDGVNGAIWLDDSISVEDRIDLLVRNAALGLLLVGLLLMAFLDLRIALWTAFGVGVSFIGAFVFMAFIGITINQMTLFGFILAIGIVVDDAIVVGENIHTAWRKDSSDPLAAAEAGVTRVISPVMFSVTTTIMVFVPLLFIPGTFGDFLAPIAAVVIIVLILSLVESFLILPRHLSHMDDAPPGRFDPRRLADPIRNRVARRLRQMREGPVRAAVTFCTWRPLMTVLIATGIFIASLSTMASGQVKFIFFPEIEGDYVTAELELSEAASQTQTLRFTQAVVDGAYAAADNIPGDNAVEGVLWSLGESMGVSSPVANPESGAAANKVYVTVKLLTASERQFSAVDFEMAWRQQVGEIPGAQKLSFSSNLVSQGSPLLFQISAASDEVARAAVGDLRRELSDQLGVFDVRDDRFRTTDEIQLTLKDLARSYGISQAQLAAEVRAAFFGAEAVRIQRDREEIEVRVRLPQEQRHDLDTLTRMRIPVAGGYVPLGQLASINIGPAPATIKRIDGHRVYELTADIDTNLNTGGAVTEHMLGQAFAQLSDIHDGLEVGLGGEQEEQARAAPAMSRNFMLAILFIFGLLALSFRSYSQPLIVLLAIPLGFMGGLLGHWILGLNLTLLSIFGIIGLSGVIINNALMAIDFINERLEQGETPETAIIEGMLDRFRAILLTTLTTFLGVTPIIMETSVQAQFLVPTAVSLGFGILIGTTSLFMVLPALSALHLRIFGHPNMDQNDFDNAAAQPA
ncbi:MAG: efflux RND transporter permease subunit, partial [Pseudomonadota bacterium]